MLVKTSELSGEQLDQVIETYVQTNLPDMYALFTANNTPFQPSSDWNQGGILIEVGKIALLTKGNAYYERDNGIFYSYGNTVLEAAMRAFVASKLGEVFELP